MTEPEKTATAPSLQEFLRSDLLPHLVGLIRAFPSLRTLFPQLLQLRFVIDANIVQGELRWRLNRRKNPTARTALHEVLACGVLVAYAPHFLEEEIKEHTPNLARETKSSVTDVSREWKEFRELLYFYTARTKAKMDVSRTDPDDVAYIDTMEEIAARAIYTRDSDFLRTSAPVVLVAIDTPLRQYARASTIRIAVMMGSSISIAFGFEALLALGRLLEQLARAARRLPPAVQLLIVGTLLAVLAHPKSRARLSALWKQLNEHIGERTWELLVGAMYQFADATAKEREAYHAIQEVLPPARKRPLLSHVRAVCAASRRPLTVDEIVVCVIENGYQPRSDRPHAYLVRKLRSDGSFVESARGWTLSSSKTRVS
jgi:predicted nucleic acid-binding protein